MKILHVSYHYGCASDLNYVFKTLGHDITFLEATCWPYTISEDLANNIWNERRDYFQSFDVIITSDTVALSMPFLLHFEELKPRLVVWICNRFNIFMEKVPSFLPLLQKYKNRISIIPYIEYERRWCSKFGLHIGYETINPLGRHIEKYICNESVMHRIFRPLNRSCQTRSDDETIFVPDYHNNKRLVSILSNNQISFVHGRYMDVNEIKPYKAVATLPDAFGKIFYHEAIQHEIPLLLPSPSFIDKLVKEDDYHLTSKQHEDRDDIHVYCEYYKYKHCYAYYDSYDDLVNKLRNMDDVLNNLKETLAAQKDIIHDRIINQWKRVLSVQPSTITAAIYNGLPGHHEMIGHAIEYCRLRGYQPIVYTNYENEYGWIDFYKRQFDDLAVHSHDEFVNNTNASDIVFLLTDDDWVFPAGNVDNKKIVCIDHWYKIRRNSNIKRVDIRKFERTENDRWALPTYKTIDRSEKIALLRSEQKIRIGCVGLGGSLDVQNMKRLFKNFDDIEFYVFKNSKYTIDNMGNENIKGFIEEKATNMIEALKKCHYSLLLPEDCCYYHEKMSGSIPLAFATGCRIITTSRIQELYGLGSCFVIDPSGEPFALPPLDDNDIGIVYDELGMLLDRRNKWYDKFADDIRQGL